MFVLIINSLFSFSQSQIKRKHHFSFTLHGSTQRIKFYAWKLKKRRRKSTQTNEFDWMVEKFKIGGRSENDEKRQNKLNLGSFFQAWFCSNGRGSCFPVQLPLKRPPPAAVMDNTRATCSPEMHLEMMVHPQIFTTRCTSGEHVVPILVHQVKVLHLYFSIFLSFH